MVKRRYALIGLGLLLLLLAILILPNWRSLYEGIFFYLRFAVTPLTASQPVRPDGRYSSLYDLIRLRNSERYRYLIDHLNLPGLTVVQIPIADYPQPDLLITSNDKGPYTVYCAHYDKAYDDPQYQGASDNTAAVSVLLASVTGLARGGGVGNRAFLFTGQEESALGGAAAFVGYARAKNLPVREIIDFDSLGRGLLTIRPSADLPGFVFTLPFYGDIVYDGREFRPDRPYPLPSKRLTQALSRVQPDMVQLERFTALSDSNVFQANGLDTVAISADDQHYLELAWDTYADRVELLDEGNLDRAFNLVLNYP
jgi:Zn-dependent M28 family amino/carboxypeptidase